MDPRMVPKGSGPEFNYDENSPGGVGRSNEPGVYFHPQANKFIETARVQTPDGSVAYHPDQGRIQGDAFTQFGFRPATDEELKEYQAQQRKAENSTTTSMSSSYKR